MGESHRNGVWKPLSALPPQPKDATIYRMFIEDEQAMRDAGFVKDSWQRWNTNFVRSAPKKSQQK